MRDIDPFGYPDRDRQPIGHHMPETRTIGRCIYCPATEDLTKEHVVPFGLAGGLILHEASCKACATKTGKFEQAILKEWSIFRAQNEVPTRSKNSRPKTGTIILEGGSRVEVPVEEMPSQVLLYSWPNEPGIISGRPPRDLDEPWIHILTKDDDRAQRLVHQYGTFRILHRKNLPEYLRLITKIAHGFVVAEYGLEGLNPFLLPCILDGNLSGLAAVVGKAPCDLPPNNSHSFSTSTIGQTMEGPWLAYCDLRLMMAGAPSHRVVVGYYEDRPQCRCPPPQLSV